MIRNIGIHLLDSVQLISGSIPLNLNFGSSDNVCPFVGVSGNPLPEVSGGVRNHSPTQFYKTGSHLRIGKTFVDCSAQSDRPSIAVLPFQNMSGDPEQEYFADGMVDEIITGLSRIKWLSVISQNSTFIYKNKPVAVSAR